MIEIKCPSCGKSFEVPDSLRGGSERCPGCGLELSIPDKSVAAKPDPVMLLTEAIPAKAPAHRSVAATNRRKPKVERSTITESAMAIFGALFFVAGLICAVIGFVFLLSDEHAAPGAVYMIFTGLGVTISGLPFWAIHHVLRYLRRLVNAA